MLRSQGNEETRNSQESFCPPGTEIFPNFPSSITAALLQGSKIAGIAPGPPNKAFVQLSAVGQSCDSAASVVGSAEVPPPCQTGTYTHIHRELTGIHVTLRLCTPI